MMSIRFAAVEFRTGQEWDNWDGTSQAGRHSPCRPVPWHRRSAVDRGKRCKGKRWILKRTELVRLQGRSVTARGARLLRLRAVALALRGAPLQRRATDRTE